MNEPPKVWDGERWVLPKEDYRLVYVWPSSRLPFLLRWWGLDVFVWHVPLLKLVLLFALIGWFLG